MNPVSAWWRNICQPLDGVLWRNGINHGVIRPMLRNQILAAGAAILCGGVLYVIWPWLFWAACGFCIMTWIFLSWARFFLRIQLGVFGAAFLRTVLFRFGLGLLILSALLIIAMRYFSASGGAIIVGLICGTVLGFVNFVIYMRRGA